MDIAHKQKGETMKIGDEVYVHGYVDVIRNGTTSDCISRQAAIDALCDNCDNPQAVCAHYPCDRYTAIEDLPSAQPEIIRCKDCKNSEHWYRDRRRCFFWAENGVSVFDDGFCSYAERREDGQDNA